MSELVKIHENLFISGFLHNNNAENELKSNNIVAVVNLYPFKTYNPPSYIHYLQIGFKNGIRISPEIIEKILSFIDKHISTGPVLVQCNRGISRSGAIICARLLVENPTWDWENALRFVRKKKRIMPHPFLKESILTYFEVKEGKRREKKD
ncbi:MAG: dual specificity protein phosphatase family protein [Promethearchaeota archaeon]